MLLTIGYEGSSIDDFINSLCEYGVSHVADVRDVPISRKKGFSKNLLAARLHEAGINYSHFKPLGDPKAGREASRRGDIVEFRKIYLNVLASEVAQDAISKLINLSCEERVCLLCYERLPKDCHRSMIANEVQDREGLEVVHVGVRNGTAGNLSRGSADFSEGLAARWAETRRNGLLRGSNAESRVETALSC